MLKNLLYVMLGGAVGAGLRYLVSLACSAVKWMNFPLGTFVVNIVGCFLLGLLCGYGQRWTGHTEWLLLLSVGVCGAFTTFSTFTADTIHLLDNGQFWWALAYVCASLFLGFLLFYLARRLTL